LAAPVGDFIAVDRHTALRVLGVGGDATPEQVRARYLELLWAHHPDVADAGNGSFDAAAIVEAYHVLKAEPASPRERVSVRADGDTLVLGLPADETFAALVEMASQVGHLAYLDADTGLLESVVTIADGKTCSLVISLQGRAAGGTTDAFCTIEALGQGSAPPIEPIVEELAALLDGSLNS
jgi:hypothetical protein